MKRALVLTATAVLATEALVAGQQFTATPLPPAGALYSRVNAVTATSAGGAVITDRTHPTLWDYSENWTSLAPTSDGPGEVYGIWGDQQVGRYSSATLGSNGAMLWEGTAASAVSLHPAGSSFSKALAIRGEQQVGYAAFLGTPERAALWRGTAASYVNLHPAGAWTSEAFSTDGVRQGGRVDGLAVLWSGSAESMVSMHPPGAIASSIRAMVPGQQAGDVVIPGLGTCAAVWNDGVPGWTNLTPQGGVSHIYGTTGLTQVGYSAGEAAAWFNTPESYINLALLPPGYGESLATSVWQDENQIIIGGYADRVGVGFEAMIWRATIPGPGTFGPLAAAGVFASRRRR